MVVSWVTAAVMAAVVLKSDSEKIEIPGAIFGLLLLTFGLCSTIATACGFRVLFEDLGDWRGWVGMMLMSSPWMILVAPFAPII